MVQLRRVGTSGGGGSAWDATAATGRGSNRPGSVSATTASASVTAAMPMVIHRCAFTGSGYGRPGRGGRRRRSATVTVSTSAPSSAGARCATQPASWCWRCWSRPPTSTG
jgi:hypothetical protein